MVALGLVLAVMRQLDQPATVERLDELFGAHQQSALEPHDEQTVAEIGPTKNATSNQFIDESLNQSDDPPIAAEPDGIDLSAVQDKTYFRPEERSVWFALLGQLQQMDETQLADKSVGELTYAQLLQQPEVYRGRVVTLHGTVLREEPQQLDDNPLGLAEYHRLWIQPQGGGQWPFVVYCLRLPSGFPRGDAIRAKVQVRGFFFKNWSYPWEDGLGLAPVVLADQPIWHPPAPRAARKQSSWQNWALAIIVACACAIGVTWLAIKRTQRRMVRPAQDEAIRQRFAQLAEEDDA